MRLASLKPSHTEICKRPCAIRPTHRQFQLQPRTNFSLPLTISAPRDLTNAAGRTLPTLLLAVLALSGIILAINSVILVVESHGRSSFVVLLVVVLVAFDLALLLVLAAPFRGTLQALPTPVESVVHEIDSGFFTR